MISFTQSGARQHVQSPARQRLVAAVPSGLDMQQITVVKNIGGWASFLSAAGQDPIEGSSTIQRRGRTFYRTRTTDYTFTPDPDSGYGPISYSAADVLADGRCPQVSGMPTGATYSEGYPTGFTGDNKTFALAWGFGLLSDTFTNSSSTNETVRTKTHYNVMEDSSDEVEQNLSNAPALNADLDPLFTAVRSRNWSQYPTGGLGDNLNYYRLWRFDEYDPIVAVGGSNINTTGLDPADYSETISPNDQSGVAGSSSDPTYGWPSLLYPNLKLNPNLDNSIVPGGIISYIEANALISGWGFGGLLASTKGTIFPLLNAVRSRFRVRRRVYPYFIAKSKHTKISGQTYFTGVELVRQGYAHPGQWIEIPFFTGDAPADWRVACVSPHRLEIGECYFAVINESYSGWLSRTGYLGA